MISVTYDNSDTFVAKCQRKGVSVSWNGWAMEFFSPSPSAYNSPQGVRKGNEWGFINTVEPNNDGLWLVPLSLTRGSHARR